MRSTPDILRLLDELDRQSADSLEDQDLDFKRWIARSLNDSVAMVVEMGVCMANGGGGMVVFGVDDHVVGRSAAILGVAPEVDGNRLKKAVYDATDPKLTPVFEELRVPEGTGRVLVMQIYRMIAPDVFRRLRETGTQERDRRIDWEAAKTRIMSVLRQRAERGEQGLSNEEIRRITHLDSNQAGRLMRELLEEVSEVKMTGSWRYVRYIYEFPGPS